MSALTEPIYVDADMWEKIVLNLLSNALKFTFDGEIAVRIEDRGGDVGAGRSRYRRLARVRSEAARDLRASEEALRRRTTQFETLLNEAPLGVYLVDADLRI